MKSNAVVIIACKKLCNNLCYATKLEYENGRKIDYISIYLCGAEDNGKIIPFLEGLLKKEGYSKEQKELFKKALDFVKETPSEPISEELKLFLACNMHNIEFNSWKCMTELMSSNRYCFIPIAKDHESSVTLE